MPADLPAGEKSPMGHCQNAFDPRMETSLNKDSPGIMPVEIGVKTRGKQDHGGKRAEFLADSPEVEMPGIAYARKHGAEVAKKGGNLRKGKIRDLVLVTFTSIIILVFVVYNSSHLRPKDTRQEHQTEAAPRNVSRGQAGMEARHARGASQGRETKEGALVAKASRAAEGNGGRNRSNTDRGEAKTAARKEQRRQGAGSVTRNQAAVQLQKGGRGTQAVADGGGKTARRKGIEAARNNGQNDRKKGGKGKGKGEGGGVSKGKAVEAAKRAASSGKAGSTEEFACDRSHWRTDVCVMRGDVRVDARAGGAVVLYAAEAQTPRGEERVRPYTRKWEESLMEGVQELVLQSVDPPPELPRLPPLSPEDSSKQGAQGEGRGGREVAKGKARASQRRRKLLGEEGGGQIPIKMPEGMGRELTGPDGETSFGRLVRKMTSRRAEERKAIRAKRLSLGVTQLMFLEVQREEEDAEARERGESPEQVERGWRSPQRREEHPTNRTQAGVPLLRCDVRHSVPAVAFSTAGYTGNLYHEFNDGLIPLYITSHHLQGEVVFIVMQAHVWWFLKYEHVLRQMSKYPAVLLGQDEYVHCFPELTAGLRIHDELTVDPTALPPGSTASIQDFQLKLKQAWKGWPFKQSAPEGPLYGCRPLLSIIARTGTRAISNQEEVVQLAQAEGFLVRVLVPISSTALQDMWHNLQDSNAMLGVHGAGMTHFLFMRPKSAYVQVVPLGTDWAAKTYYGDPAVRLGLQYSEYKVGIQESSLSQKYGADDPVVTNPQSVLDKGWWAGKEVYLENQNVTLDLERLRNVLKNIKVQLKDDPLYVQQKAKAARSKHCQVAQKKQ